MPIYLGAMGQKMLRLAGEIADGVILNDFTPLDRLSWALDQIDAGAKRGGRRAEDLEIVKRRALLVTENEVEAREALEFFPVEPIRSRSARGRAKQAPSRAPPPS